MTDIKKKTNAQENKTEINNSDKISGGKNIFIIKNPLITEKSYSQSLSGKYSFLVERNANKSEIKKAIKSIYKVDIIGVNTINIKGKDTRFGAKTTKHGKYKKAIVELKSGQKIDTMPA
ncbi:50S ribosomal protein L23 [Candidatus Wolfebacteria bacterium CG10_big_fil_rev_8_21_14_0_10_31_9]|uniref:Large ribosomal subunit protein uL23 n=1 Tax=Candidatus Wolfebacteria bacterium CG10_big_fil_rev_8_21_14_0_10_31_9 TaxID=1975070 RepID=A0A2H0RCQ5_9BACT|nr:MAG: 50S ribosomal protein L23 [Candidatus Wolfebacteria bacterium CG10_big_fil_rev_8_21_14_0_10_31_9]